MGPEMKVEIVPELGPKTGPIQMWSLGERFKMRLRTTYSTIEMRLELRSEVRPEVGSEVV